VSKGEMCGLGEIPIRESTIRQTNRQSSRGGMHMVQQSAKKSKEVNPTIEEKVELLLQSLVSSIFFLSLIGLASLILVGFLYPAPLNWVIAAISILLAVTILFSMKTYTKL